MVRLYLETFKLSELNLDENYVKDEIWTEIQACNYDIKLLSHRGTARWLIIAFFLI